MLGFYGVEERLDMSNFLVHITRGGYREVMSILYQNRLEPGPKSFGCAPDAARGVEEEHRAVCFTETPLGFLKQLAAGRSLYGLGFTKQFALFKGAAPVWYLPYRCKAKPAIRELIQESMDRRGRRKYALVDSPIWSITPFIEYQRPQINWQWEREWRIPGPDGLEFKNEDVAFLVIPEQKHQIARGFFEDFYGQFDAPSFDCIYIDATWSIETVKEKIDEFNLNKRGNHDFALFKRRVKNRQKSIKKKLSKE